MRAMGRTRLSPGFWLGRAIASPDGPRLDDPARDEFAQGREFAPTVMRVLAERDFVKRHRPGEIIALGEPDASGGLEIGELLEGLDALDDDAHTEARAERL